MSGSNKTDKIFSWLHIPVQVILWLIFLPIMVVVKIWQSERITLKNKKIVTAVIIVLACFYVIGSNEQQELHGVSSGDDWLADSVVDDALSAYKAADEPRGLFAEVINDAALRADFATACAQIGMDMNKIKGLEKAGSWAAGSVYDFSYAGNGFRLYCNTDSTVNTIKSDNDIDIYKQGYEPYRVEDYIITADMAAKLQSMAEKQVKSQLNYPSTADFSWLNWSYAREVDVYSVASSVQAENAFGVKSEVPFMLQYKIADGSATLIYFALNGTVITDNTSSVALPERKEIPLPGNAGQSAPDADSIVLVDGQLGDYGKYITLDGEEYINYHVPEGKYTVVSNVNYCKVYLAKDEYYKVAEGYTENDIVETLEFYANGESKTLTVHADEHIELTLSAKITLTPQA